MSTKIEWADITINPVVGCSHCSPGCDHCYAERFAARLAKNPKTAAKYAGVVDERGKWTGKVNLHMDGCLHAATVTRKPKRFFIGSMTDIFHENIPDEEIRSLFLAMTIVPNDFPTYMVLTKRPQRAQAVLGDMLVACPELHRVWLGVTVCNQAEADAKIPVLLQTPAAVHFVSIEPMLGPVDLQAAYPHDWMHCKICGWYGPDDGEGGADHITNEDGSEPICPQCGNDGEAGEFDWTREAASAYRETILPGLNWVICGGETGPGARPLHPDWVRGLRDQCAAAGTPFFFQGWGEWCPRFNHYLYGMDDSANMIDPTEKRWETQEVTVSGETDLAKVPYRELDWVTSVGKRRSGRLLDGREWNEVPEVSC